MNKADLVALIRQRQSFLCVGLDPDLDKIPNHLLDSEDPIFEFCKGIIDATRDLCVAYKPNTAFFEAYGLAGWAAFEKTVRYIGANHLIIADAKRGDIGNTSTRYAKAFFEALPCDAITVAPYMGADSVQPFLAFPDKWTIVLGLTSNQGSQDFQRLSLKGAAPTLFEQVLSTIKTWGSPDQLMFVVGATHPEDFQHIRTIIPDHFLLVPGVGAQGGDLQQVAKFGMNKDIGLLINSARGIIYASKGTDFAEAARAVALEMQREMAEIMG